MGLTDGKLVIPYTHTHAKALNFREIKNISNFIYHAIFKKKKTHVFTLSQTNKYLNKNHGDKAMKKS